MSVAVRMSPEDSAFWRMGSQASRTHCVTVAIFDGPAPEFDELEDHIGQRVHLVPRFRQRVLEVPLDLGRPMWVDDPEFDLHNHLTAMHSETGMDGLGELVSRAVSERLDTARPLWHLTIVSGLPDDRWALVSKVHHSMIDGLFGTEPLAVLVDGAVTHPSPPTSWNPPAPPSDVELIGRTIAEYMFNPTEQYRLMRARSRQTQRRFERLTGHARPREEIDASGLRGPIGETRSWNSIAVAMPDIRDARDRLGVNTHELVLALVTSGLRDLLVSRQVDQAIWPTIKAIVPMAVAGSTSRFHGGIAAEVVELPVAEPDLASRVRHLNSQTRKASSNPVAVDAQIGVAGFSAPALASLGLREAARRGSVERGAHTVVVNVPGPRRELSLLGRPMSAIQPVPPLAAGVRLSVGVYSYLDNLTFGVTADRESMPDADVVISGIRSALTTLAESN